MGIIEYFTVNPVGRDFVVGDIHGMYRALEALMERVGFDPDRDRLFSVGDLADRGPDSREMCQWLAKPWFHPVRGNHDQFILDCRSEMDIAFWVANNGGEWWLDVPDSQRAVLRAAVARLPYVIEVETAQSAVGIVHADVPYGMHWQAFKDALEQDEQLIREQAIWSRKRISDAAASRPTPRVEGVELVVCGHTPMPDHIQAENVLFLDTGAAYTDQAWASLTVVQVHPDRGRIESVRTSVFH